MKNAFSLVIFLFCIVLTNCTNDDNSVEDVISETVVAFKVTKSEPMISSIGYGFTCENSDCNSLVNHTEAIYTNSQDITLNEGDNFWLEDLSSTENETWTNYSTTLEISINDSVVKNETFQITEPETQASISYTYE